MQRKKSNIDRKVYVVGHKNPDTDSICSAIAYARYKRMLTGNQYVAYRAGRLNEETMYVLKRFQIPIPALLATVKTQVKDIDLRNLTGIAGKISIKTAWELMKKEKIKTLPIVRGKKLEGLITIGDIATSYMDVYDNRILATARTQYSNIIKVIEGSMIMGNEHSYLSQGKVAVAASEQDLMADFIEENDLVIVGNRTEEQLFAVRLNISCLVVCQGARVHLQVIEEAKKRDVVVISTKLDTFSTARLIHQSIPVKHFMTKDNLITFHPKDYIDNIREKMTNNRFRDFPVLDDDGSFIGFISRRRLLDAKKKQVILVDHNEKSQAVDGIDEADILEIIDHHRIGNLETISPVFFRNQPLGCTATIVYQMYQEKGLEVDKETAGILCAAVISDTLMLRSPTCTAIDATSAYELAEIAGIELEEFAKNMFNAGSNFKKRTVEEICFQDFKQFTFDSITFGVSQVNFLDKEEVEGIREKIIEYLPNGCAIHRLDMLFIMLTNIIEESTELLYYGEDAKGLLEDAFDLEVNTHPIILKGMVSRKKQLLPAIMTTLQQ